MKYMIPQDLLNIGPVLPRRLRATLAHKGRGIRKYRVRIILWLFICLFTPMTLAATPVDATPDNHSAFLAVEQQLANSGDLAGQFKQTQYIQLLSAPLMSEGQFSLSTTSGLLWQQTKPFPSTLRMTQEKIIQQLGNTPETVLTKTQQPVVFAFANLFISIAKGDTKTLTTYFHITFQGNPAQWQIQLTPTTSPMNKAIARIDMTGSRYVQTVSVRQVNGNQTDIVFVNVHPQVKSP